MEIKLQKINSDSELISIYDLYFSAFPANERRDYAGLKAQLKIHECSVSKILHGKQQVGLCIFWNFEDFVFLEHLAVEPAMRNLKIGEKVLTLLKTQFNKPLLLETEPPNDEIAKRRISFYIRNSFFILSRNYIQPSYDHVSPGVHLCLMCTCSGISDPTLDRWISILRNNVYGYC
jgi:ribosomal protein S18 acetylase RimI-like enzyme